MRKIAGLLFTAAIVIGALGCSSSSGPTASGSDPAKDTGGGGKSIVGKWTGKIEVEKKGTDDAASKMAESMAGMFGDFDLEIMDGNRFKLLVMGLPTEGAMTLNGSKFTLTPEKVMGKTIEEMKKLSEKNGQVSGDAGKPMSGEISADMQTLTIVDEAKPDSKLVFKRSVETPKVIGPSSVTEAEKALVGSYRAEVDTSTLKADEKQMFDAIKDALALSLEEDNTFDLNMAMKFKGKWKIVGDNVELRNDKGDDLKTFKIDGTTLTYVEKTPTGPTLKFVKK